jgi:hypothetical protein
MLRRTFSEYPARMRQASTTQLGGGGINDFDQKGLARKLATAFLRGDYGRTPSALHWKGGRGHARGGDERGGEEGGEEEEAGEEGEEGEQKGGEEITSETVRGKKRKENEEEKSGGEEIERKVVCFADGRESGAVVVEVDADKRAAADETVAREVAMEEGFELGVLSVRGEDTSEFEMAV